MLRGRRRHEPREYTVAQAPGEAGGAPGVYRTADNRPFAVNVDTRESARIEWARRFCRYGAAIARPNFRLPPHTADRVRARAWAEYRPGPHHCYTGCRISHRSARQYHDHSAHFTTVRIPRRWRAEPCCASRSVARPSLLPRRSFPGQASPYSGRWHAGAALAGTTVGRAGRARSDGLAGGPGRQPSDKLPVEERVALRSDVPPLEDVLVSAVEEASLTAPAGLPRPRRRSSRRFASTPQTSSRTEHSPARERLRRPPHPPHPRRIDRSRVADARQRRPRQRGGLPQSIQVEVLPGDAVVPAGQPLTIRASVRAGGDFLTRFTPRLTFRAGTPRMARTSAPFAMTPDGGGFVFSFE